MLSHREEARADKSFWRHCVGAPDEVELTLRIPRCDVGDFEIHRDTLLFGSNTSPLNCRFGEIDTGDLPPRFCQLNCEDTRAVTRRGSCGRCNVE